MWKVAHVKNLSTVEDEKGRPNRPLPREQFKMGNFTHKNIDSLHDSDTLVSSSGHRSPCTGLRLSLIGER